MKNSIGVNNNNNNNHNNHFWDWQECWKDRQEYWEESLRLEETSCHWNFSERLPADADVKEYQWGGNKPEGSSERRKTKEISTKGKTIHTKQDIPKQRKKISSTSGRAWHKNIPTTRHQRTERFWTKIWQPKKHNEKAEWINDMARELEGLEEGPKAEIHIELLKKTLKKVSNWKTPGHDGIHGYWFKKSPPFTTD